MRDKLIAVKVTEKELARVKKEAAAQGVSVSEILRDLIKQLPTPA
jgi:predicted DNA binding CopG/RHH family protein